MASTSGRNDAVRERGVHPQIPTHAEKRKIEENVFQDPNFFQTADAVQAEAQ
jgi:hypothetical protein